MPREDVPYPGSALCRLKCQINELWQAVRNKLHSINGVPGDGNGDVKILAGQNVQIVNDQVHNEITISAAGSSEDIVKSVNGIAPDADGDVTIDTGVMTVNGVTPDADGDVSVGKVVTINNVTPDADGEITITAGTNITITPDADTNSIEIASAGGSGDWQMVTSTNWSDYKEGAYPYVAKQDMVIFVSGQGFADDCYIPKGAVINNILFNTSYADSNYIYFTKTPSTSYASFFDNRSSYNLDIVRINVSDSTISTSSVSLSKRTDPASVNNGIRLFVKV